MTVEQILKISQALLVKEKEFAINDGYKKAAESALNKVVSVMTDDRAILSDIDLADAEKRFCNILFKVSSSTAKEEAHLIYWLHTIIVNMCSLERKGLINVL